jgi:hypothetical protein
MIRLIIKLAIIGLIVFAALKIGPVFWTNLRYKDALAETAKFASKRTAADVEEKARKIAADLEIPSTPNAIAVAKKDTLTIIDTRYTAQLEYFPQRYYPWEFVIHVEEGPPRYADVMP